MATAKRLPSGSYRVRVKVEGYPIVSVTRATKAATERDARRVKTDMEAGTYKDTREAKQVLLRDVADDYLKHVQPEGAKKASAKKRDPMLPLLLRDIKGRFGGYALANITPKMVSEWRDDLLASGSKRTGGGLSPASVNKLIARLSGLFTYAIKTKHIPVVNPVRGNVEYATGKATKVRRRLRPGEEERLLAALEAGKVHPVTMYRYTKEAQARAKKSGATIKGEAYEGRRTIGPYARLAFVLFVEAGLREGELADQLIADLDLDAYSLTTKVSKNDEAREVPLSPRAVKALREALALTERRTKAGEIEEDAAKLAFGGVSAFTLWQEFRAAADSIGSTDLDIHCLRHEAASRLAPKFQLHELMKVLGWKSESMARVYYHARGSELAERLREPVPTPTAAIDPTQLGAVIAALQASGYALVKQ